MWVLVLKSTKENNITTFLIEKIKSSLDNVLLFCDERKDDESLEILLNFKKNQIEVYQTKDIKPDHLYTSSEGRDWVDEKFNYKNGSVSDYIILSGGFLAINLDIHSDVNVLLLKEYVLYFIKEIMLPEIALCGVYTYYSKSEISGRFFDSFINNYFYISTLFHYYGEIPEEFSFTLEDMFSEETKGGYYKVVELYKKSIDNWNNLQVKMECFYSLLSVFTKNSTRSSRWLTREFEKIANNFTKEERGILFELAICELVGISVHDGEDPYSSVASTYHINYKLFYTIENICGEKLSNILPDNLKNKLLSFRKISDFYNNSFPVYFSSDNRNEIIERAMERHQRLLIDDGYKEDDLMEGKILALIYRYSLNLKLTNILTSTDFSKNRLRFETINSFYDTYFKFLIEYFGEELNPKYTIITVHSGLINEYNSKHSFLNFLICFKDVEKIVVESAVNFRSVPIEDERREKLLNSKYNRNKNVSISSEIIPVSPIDININQLIQ